MATSLAMSGQVAPHAPKRSNDNPIAGGAGKLSCFYRFFCDSCYTELLEGEDPVSIIRSYSSKLAEATLDPVWLANELCSEGLLDTQTRNDLTSTVGVSAYNKAVELWSRIEVIVKIHENPDQALLTVCNVMKQRTELAPLAQAMSSLLKPHEDLRLLDINLPQKWMLHEADEHTSDDSLAIELEIQPPNASPVYNSSQFISV